MKIGRVVLVPVFLLVMAGAGLAASYEMLLNQNDKICTTLLNLINDDLKRYGTIRYDTHDKFAAIKWKPLSEELGEKFKDGFCSVDRIATFDLNNDGHIDIVVKFSGCFKSRLMDSIFFLNVDRQLFLTYDYGDIVKNSVGRFPADYEELSNYLLRTPVGKKQGRASESEGIGGWLVINPFLYGSTAYLAVTDRGVSGESASGEGFLIGKYKSSEELEEVCYFKQKPAGKQKVHK